jgi:hypothetical protein
LGMVAAFHTTPYGDERLAGRDFREAATKEVSGQWESNPPPKLGKLVGIHLRISENVKLPPICAFSLKYNWSSGGRIHAMKFAGRVQSVPGCQSRTPVYTRDKPDDSAGTLLETRR